MLGYTILHEPLSETTYRPTNTLLALQLGDLDTASAIAAQLDAEPKWRQLGELAMTSGELAVAAQCLARAKDFSGLLLMRSAMGGCVYMVSMADACAYACLEVAS